MYYAKTKKAVEDDKRISDTFDKMRDFYAEENYAVLRRAETFDDLEELARFWDDVANRRECFTASVLKKLYVLSYSPYSIWEYVVSLYYMIHRELAEEKFCAFADKTMAMILVNGIFDFGKQNIRRPFVLEFKDIFRGEPLAFDEQFKPQEKILRRRLADMRFTNNKPITRAMLAWWTFSDPAQNLPPLKVELHQEHIYAKNRHESFQPLKNPDALEFLGNKALLEEKINKKISDNSFSDKKNFYRGDGKSKPATFNLELRGLAERYDDFTEDDIIERNEKIFDAFIEYLRKQRLLS